MLYKIRICRGTLQPSSHFESLPRPLMHINHEYSIKMFVYVCSKTSLWGIFSLVFARFPASGYIRHGRLSFQSSNSPREQQTFITALSITGNMIDYLRVVWAIWKCKFFGFTAFCGRELNWYPAVSFYILHGNSEAELSGTSFLVNICIQNKNRLLPKVAV